MMIRSLIDNASFGAVSDVWTLMVEADIFIF